MDSPRMSRPRRLPFWISPFLPPFEDPQMDAGKPAGCSFSSGALGRPRRPPSCEMQRSSGRGLVESGKKAVKAPA